MAGRPSYAVRSSERPENIGELSSVEFNLGRKQPRLDHRLPGDWTQQGLQKVGFTGFVPFADLPAAGVPDAAGVYVVLREASGAPEFLASSPAGKFKGRDPSVTPERLRDNWVDSVGVVYIGKASAATPRRGLRRRLEEYRRHGTGQRVGHWGGRFVWQLADSAELLVAWRPSVAGVDAAAEESALLSAFVQSCGVLPFANLRR